MSGDGWVSCWSCGREQPARALRCECSQPLHRVRVGPGEASWIGPAEFRLGRTVRIPRRGCAICGAERGLTGQTRYFPPRPPRVAYPLTLQPAVEIETRRSNLSARAEEAERRRREAADQARVDLPVCGSCASAWNRAEGIQALVSGGGLFALPLLGAGAGWLATSGPVGGLAGAAVGVALHLVALLGVRLRLVCARAAACVGVDEETFTLRVPAPRPFARLLGFPDTVGPG